MTDWTPHYSDCSAHRWLFSHRITESGIVEIKVKCPRCCKSKVKNGLGDGCEIFGIAEIPLTYESLDQIIAAQSQRDAKARGDTNAPQKPT